MDLYVERHTPLLTSRVEFNLLRSTALPPIASRIEFTEDRLVDSEGGAVGEDGVSGGNERSLSPESEEPVRRSQRGKKTTTVATAADKLICKPRGEEGRPGSGGFNLQNDLIARGWSKESFDDLKVVVRAAAEKGLNTNVSYLRQEVSAIQEICNEVSGIEPERTTEATH
ncbi:hypothetical protein DXG01_010724 [Tephrocybe rancida]|nr:hypothetical protein DXG01_010724 [Tephrocybe rancida]